MLTRLGTTLVRVKVRIKEIESQLQPNSRVPVPNFECPPYFYSPFYLQTNCFQAPENREGKQKQKEARSNLGRLIQEDDGPASFICFARSQLGT